RGSRRWRPGPDGLRWARAGPFRAAPSIARPDRGPCTGVLRLPLADAIIGRIAKGNPQNMSTPATRVPQLTARAIILSVILAVILAAANAYLGLFAGLTIATAIPAAVVSMGVLRLLGGGTILENNIVQTGASAGSSIAAGVIFTIPALI